MSSNVCAAEMLEASHLRYFWRLRVLQSAEKRTHVQTHRELHVAMAIRWEVDMIEWLRFDCHSVLQSHDSDFHRPDVVIIIIIIISGDYWASRNI